MKKVIYAWREKTIALALLVAMLLSVSGCYTHRPTAHLTVPDYNTRVHVADAGYLKKQNAIGLSVNIGVIGAGAYGGYALAPFKHYQGGELKSMDGLNIAAGALIGSGLALAADLFMGRNKRLDPDKNPQDWINKVNKDYRLLRMMSNKSFSMIHPEVESRFQVKNIQDAVDFKTAFAHSAHENTMLANAAAVVQRNELPRLISVYADNPGIDAVKRKYIETAPTIPDLMAAGKFYPEITYNYEAAAFERVKTAKSAEDFLAYFPNSKHASKAFETGIKQTPIATFTDFIAKATPAVDKELVDMAKRSYIFAFDSVERITDAYLLYPEVTDKASVVRLMLKKKAINTIADLRYIQDHLGYVPTESDNAVRSVLPKVTRFESIELISIVPRIGEKLKKEIIDGYQADMQKQFNAAKGDVNKLLDFIERYGGQLYSSKIVADARYEAAYLYLKTGKGTNEQYAQFVKEHPKHAQEMKQIMAERDAAERLRKEDAKKIVGKRVVWRASLHYDTSGGGVSGFLLGAVGLGHTTYNVEYIGIVEAVLGDDAAKIIVTRARIIDPSFSSVNYIKYRDAAVEEINKTVGQVRVRKFSEFTVAE